MISLEHERAIGEQRPARRRDRVDADPASRRRRRSTSRRKSSTSSRRDDVAVHHVQRIAALRHVQLRERPPGAADRVEGAPLEPVCSCCAPSSASRTIFSAFLSEPPERPAGRGRRAAVVTPAPRACPCDVDELERAAAEVADDAVRLVEARDRRRAPRARASRSPDSSSIWHAADRRRPRARNSPPFSARAPPPWPGRAARATRIVSQSARKRASAASALSTASSVEAPGGRDTAGRARTAPSR